MAPRLRSSTGGSPLAPPTGYFGRARVFSFRPPGNGATLAILHRRITAGASYGLLRPSAGFLIPPSGEWRHACDPPPEDHRWRLLRATEDPVTNLYNRRLAGVGFYCVVAEVVGFPDEVPVEDVVSRFRHSLFRRCSGTGRPCATDRDVYRMAWTGRAGPRRAHCNVRGVRVPVRVSRDRWVSPSSGRCALPSRPFLRVLGIPIPVHPSMSADEPLNAIAAYYHRQRLAYRSRISSGPVRNRCPPRIGSPASSAWDRQGCTVVVQ